MKVNIPVMARNRELAGENRRTFDMNGVFAVNIISSPGAGKTSLLEALAGILGSGLAVIEGDVKTDRDAARIRKAGCRAVQIETGGACHLDAGSVRKAFLKLDRSAPVGILAIENVGNLICPSAYDLGEHLKIGMLSLPEGDDKVLKYPALFSGIHVLILSKTDLSRFMDFDVERAEMECRSLNPGVRIFRVSARTGEGVGELADYLLAKAGERR